MIDLDQINERIDQIAALPDSVERYRASEELGILLGKATDARHRLIAAVLGIPSGPKMCICEGQRFPRARATALDAQHWEQEFTDANTSDLLRSIADGHVTAICSERDGGIIGYALPTAGPRIAQALDDSDTIDRIHALMDGAEWDGDTADAVAWLVKQSGRSLRGPDEVPDDVDYEFCHHCGVAHMTDRCPSEGVTPARAGFSVPFPVQDPDELVGPMEYPTGDEPRVTQQEHDHHWGEDA